MRDMGTHLCALPTTDERRAGRSDGRVMHNALRESYGNSCHPSLEELCWTTYLVSKELALYGPRPCLHRRVHIILVVGLPLYEARPCCTSTFPANASGDRKCSN